MIEVRDTPKGASFAVKVQPRASKNALTGELGGGFKLALTAPPLEGRANQACVEFFANLLRVSAILRYHSLRPEQPEKSNSRRGTLGGGSPEAIGERTSRKEAERLLNFSERLHEIRTGFERPFWVANISELFERLSYYAAFASLARYLHETLNFAVERASRLTGFFGGLVWFLAVFGGTLADRMGFRRSLSLAYLILSCSYFLLGSIGAPWLAPVRNAMPLVVLVTFVLTLPALGIALVKPCVVGTTARASKENVRSIGYSIYYTLVNIGGAAGPYLASWVHQHVRVENVFRVAALSVFLMFFVVLLFFHEPRRSREAQTASLGQAAKNFLTVLSNPRFMLFLLIFSGYWIVYWQEFIILPLYIHDYINPRSDTELILVTDSLTVIALQMVVSFLTAKWRRFAPSRSERSSPAWPGSS